jgi:hypothetical protein
MPRYNDTRPLLVKPQKRDLRRLVGIRLRRVLYKFRTNSPYLSGDSIAELCDYYAYGKFENQQINLKRLQQAQSIFIPGHLFQKFLDDYSLSITAHTLVSGNSDQNFLSVPKLPESVRLFLCQNLVSEAGEFAHTLPIGLENFRLGRSGRPKFHSYQSEFEISDRVLVPPMSPTNPIRASVLEQAKDIPELFDIPTSYLNEKKYFALTRRYKYLLALEGNGFENHRIWEALYRGSIPILFRTRWSESLRQYNLPILYVDSIEEISGSLLKDFSKQYGEFNPSNLQPLWVPYWEDIIRNGRFQKPVG